MLCCKGWSLSALNFSYKQRISTYFCCILGFFNAPRAKTWFSESYLHDLQKTKVDTEHRHSENNEK